MNWLLVIWMCVNAGAALEFSVMSGSRGSAEIQTPESTPIDTTASSFWSDPAVRLLSDFGLLSPLAMSPFFGITVLSGLSQLENTQWGGAILADYTMVAENPVLKHPATFWVFLVLTILTSLPRMTKVSKPIAQALDWVESYSVLLITLIMFGIGMSMADASVATGATGVSVERSAMTPVQAGVFSFTLGGLLMVAAIVNFVVVKSVRFMFEMLIWISPIPFVDAVFEIINKVVCLGLLILYAISPLAALVVNVLIFAACVVVYRWAKRRLDYHWHFWLEPWWQWLFPSYRPFDGRHLWCFAEQDFGPFQKYDRLQVYLWEGKWMIIRYDWFWRKKVHEFTHDDLPYLECTDWKVNVVLQQQVPLRMATHRGYRKDLEKMAAGLELMTRPRLDARNERLIHAAETQGFEGLAPTE
ncbi:MAG: hypothetical protein Q8M16_07065 [Pirellulaceae bacterium]|nr:hypothetical protein [Pirellulaceae bacterium]